MFTVELKINGTLIAHIYGRNVGSVDAKTFKYTYEYYEVESSNLKVGNVTHKKNEGLPILVKKIIEDVKCK